MNLESRPAAPLIGAGEPPPVSLINQTGAAPVVLVCDHASKAVPAALSTLGLGADGLDHHIAWDRGAAAVTRRLSERLDARAVLAGFSRLVIDCNRELGHETSIAAVSDGIVVPGNGGISRAEIARRADAIFHPYHRAVEGAIADIRATGTAPAVLAIHSFTPEMDGVARPWHVCVLWDSDPRIPAPLLAALGGHDGLVAGDNVPYSAREQYGHTIAVHAAAAGLPNAMIEIREDLVRDDAGIARMADIIGGALDGILADPALYRAKIDWPKPIE
jgi:predicted N-formylglutamate amidohydrolase